MLAKVAVVFLKLVAWGLCFQAERGPRRDLAGRQMLCSSVHLLLCLCACELTGFARVLQQGGEEEWEVLAVFPEVSGAEGGLLRPLSAMWCPAPGRLPQRSQVQDV